MPAVARKGDKDSRGDVLTEGSSSVFAGDSPSFSNIEVTLPVEYNVEFATPVISEVGRAAPFDDQESIQFIPEDYPEDIPPEDDDGTVKEEAEVTEVELKAGEVSDCKNFTIPIDYNQRLSPNFTIASLSNKAYFKHNIKAQVGLSEKQILCNMQALAENILEPLRAQFGDFRITSGFRVGSGKSQHNKGMAFDTQTPGWSGKKYMEVAQWAAKNLPCDQIILEHGNSVWIHISYDRNKSKQRGQILTMYRNKFTPGFKLYYA